MSKQSFGSVAPKVGDGATLLCWTDCKPATVVWVSPSGKMMRLQEDNVVRTDSNGMSEVQSYAYTPNPDAPMQTARLTKKGWKITRITHVSVGERMAYYDYSF